LITSDLVHTSDIVCNRLHKLENKKELTTICGAFAGSLNNLHEDVCKSNRRISTLKESNRILWNALINATAERQCSPTRSTK
jgi:hypothetical protein